MNVLRRKNKSFRVRSFSGVDLLIILISFVICHYAYLDGLDFTSSRLVIVLVSLGLAYIVFAAAGLYRVRRRVLLLHTVLNRLTVGWFIVVMLVAMMAFLTKIAVDVSRVWFGLSTIMSFVGLVSARLVSVFFLAVTHHQGRSISPVVLLGGAEQLEQTRLGLENNQWAGYSVAKAISVPADAMGSLRAEHNLVNIIDDLIDTIEGQRQLGDPVAQVWLVFPLSEEETIKAIMGKLTDTSVDVCIVPDAFAMQILSGTPVTVADMSIVNVSDIRLPGTAELFKRFFDRVFALVALLLLLPVFLVIIYFIKTEGSGPILFRQQRYGVDGREIEVWKFRSMSVQENDALVTQVTKGDQRVTRIGAFLRKHSLDELPQFINVLQGDMSIVGPRPHAVSHNEEYRVKIEGYMMRHKIKPGITGWAQVNGWRGETDTLEKMEMRVKYDLDYIRNWSVWLDVKIIFLTISEVFTGRDVY